jgi:hypothetical protein
MAPAFHLSKRGVESRASDQREDMQRGRSDEKISLSVVVGTLHLSIIAYAVTLRLSPSFIFSEEEAPRLRLGSRSSAPRPVAMSGLLTRPDDERKRFGGEHRTLFRLFPARLD